MVHGDDFIGVGPNQHLTELRKTLEDKYKLKVEMLGRGAGEKPEIRILNKVVRETEAGIEMEADPRHVEIAIRELGIENAKAAATPGAKEQARDSGDQVKGKFEKTSRQTEIRKSLREMVENRCQNIVHAAASH